MGTDRPPRIVLEGVRRSFLSHGQVVPILRGVDLVLEPGEAVAISGPSGSGKSTLLSVLALIDPGFEGGYLFDGHDVRSTPEATLATWRLARIGVAFQDLWLVENLTSLENVMIPIIAAGEPEEAAKRRGEALLAEAGVAHRAGTLPGLLSGGERRRVAFARALANRPALLLLDEPTAELDDASASAILGMVRSAHEQGASLVCASHDRRLLDLCDRHFRVEDGRLSGDAGLLGAPR